MRPDPGALLAYHHGNLKQALLERAAAVLAERGVEGLSLRALARDLGVSHAAPRRHFPDRAALIAELAKEGFRRAAEGMRAGAEAAGPDPVARYRGMGRAYARFAREQPAFFRALNHPELRAGMDDELRALQAAWFGTVREGARAAQAAGWHPEEDAEALVAFSVAGAMGAASLFADEQWLEVLGVEDVEALADAVFDLIVHRSRTVALEKAAVENDAHDPRPSRAETGTLPDDDLDNDVDNDLANDLDNDRRAS